MSSSRESGFASGQPSRDDEHAEAAEYRGRHVEQCQNRPPGAGIRPLVRPFGKDEREVQEERRQEQARHQIGPLEEIVESIVAAARREREHAEERDREPEEMQRGRIVRSPEADGRSDRQRENAHERERVVQPVRGKRHRQERNGHGKLERRALDDVRQWMRLIGRVDDRQHVGHATNLVPLDEQQHVAGLDARARAGEGRRHVGGHDVHTFLAPQHAVFQFAAPRLDERDIHDREAHEDRRRRDGQHDTHERTKKHRSKPHLEAAGEPGRRRDRQQLVIERAGLSRIAQQIADRDQQIQTAIAERPIGQRLAEFDIEAAEGGGRRRGTAGS